MTTIRASFLAWVVLALALASARCGNQSPNPDPLQNIEPTQEETCDAGFWYDWQCVPGSTLSTWGFGSAETSYQHNDKNYDWYIDQATTGSAASNNCGPSSAVMAAKWFQQGFAETTAPARDRFPNDSDWWYTDDILNYLNLHNVPNAVVTFRSADQMQELIQAGAVLILCLNTAHIRRNTNSTQRVDRFYGYADGHFLVVKGVRQVDNSLYFEVYDPNSWNDRYADESLKGQNRHYRADDISAAVTDWWANIIVIQKDKALFKYLKTLDPKRITHQWGR